MYVDFLSSEKITSRISFHDTVIDLCIEKNPIKPILSNYRELTEILPESSICVISNCEGDIVYKLNRKFAPSVILEDQFIQFTLPFDNGTSIGDTLKISIQGFSRESISRVYKIINGVPFECISVTGEQIGKPTELVEILFPIKEITKFNDVAVSDESSEENVRIDKPVYSEDPIKAYNKQTRRVLKKCFDKKKRRLIPRGYRSKR